MKNKVIILSLLAAFLMAAAVGCGTNSNAPTNNVKVERGVNPPGLVSHGIEGKEDCAQCHDLTKYPNHPTGLVNECIQCHAFAEFK